MRIAYDEGYNCYVTIIKLRVGRYMRSLRAVIDTGATNTTVALSAFVKEQMLLDLSNKLERHAQKAGVRRAIIRSAAKESDAAEIYAYDAYFDDVIVGGHCMKQFHARIMINGAKGVCVIGNDFLNMCKYYHNAGECQLTVENPVERKYYESFSGRKVLSNDQLNMLLSEPESVAGRHLD